MRNGTNEKKVAFVWLIFVTLFFFSTISYGQETKVESVGFTVSDMDKAIDFYTKILSFKKVSDTETFGSEFEHLSGVF